MPGHPRPSSPYHQAEASLRGRLALDALRACDGVATRAASVLGVQRRTLRCWVAEAGGAEVCGPDWRAPEAAPWAPWLGGGASGRVWAEVRADLRRRMVRAALETCDGSVPRAAVALGVCSQSVEQWGA